ncbi:hypothetical protein KIPB_007035 [Kipferlia bialata]|uniref:non-specific serine/threonine protein kinase n=1 Tax=Kipferlia bialata TaxID=797122 RepID=A0A9K3CZF0_9EUKA|nr:hypothetical protein KIPB_007035 [Kipferlia bialata]|eukprot:g7035.t1
MYWVKEIVVDRSKCDKVAIMALASTLPSLRVLRKLDVRNNTFGDSAGLVLADGVACTPKLRREDLCAFDASDVASTVEALTSYAPAALSLSTAAAVTRQFLDAYPISSLKKQDCASLHSTLQSLHYVFLSCLVSVQGKFVFDPEKSVTLLSTASGLLERLRATCAIPLPQQTSSLSLTNMAKYFKAQEYNTMLALVFEAAQQLIAVAGEIDTCIAAMEGVTPPDVSECERLGRETESLLLQLSMLAKNQQDIEEIVSWLEAHPPAPIDTHEELLDKRDDLDNRSKRRRVSLADKRKIREEIAKLDIEISACVEAQSERRTKLDRLQRYRSFPRAAAFLSSATLSHPLDDTELTPFRELFCDRSVRQFQMEEFPSSSRVNMYSGVHPESHMPVILKEYNMSEPSELCSVRRELSVFSRVRAPNVVQCLGFLVEDSVCYVILERYSCDLSAYVQKFRPATVVKRHIMHEVLQGMVALDSFHIVHKDIKPQNILINHDESGNVTGVAITDFDISKSEDDFIATVRLSQTNGSGTQGYIDIQHSMPKWHREAGHGESRVGFCHLSDVYSMGKVVVWMYDPNLVIFPEPDFATEELSSVEVDVIKSCFGPKSGRLGAYHLLNKGLFAPVLSSPAPSASAAKKYTDMLAQQWTALQGVKDNAPRVECTVESLLTHFALPTEPSMDGYGEMVVLADDTEAGTDTGTLKHLLAEMSRPVTVGAETTVLFEPLGDSPFPVGPSIDACSILQEARETGDAETLSAITAHYACLGRLIAFQTLESPLEHGMFGKLVLAGLQANPNEILRDKALVSNLFAATFPQQRRSLLSLLENPVEVPFSAIPGCLSESILSHENKADFATEFETGYVRLLLEGVVEMRKGFNSLHTEWADRVGALSFNQFVSLSLGFAAFSAEDYMACFETESDEILAHFTAFVDEQMAREDITLLRRLLVFGCGSPVLPVQPISLVLEESDARVGLPTAHTCNRSISIPSGCLTFLEVAFRDSFDHEGITVGEGGRSASQVAAALNEELNRFRILSAQTHMP